MKIWRQDVQEGLLVGDIPYADRKNTLKNLNAGAQGTVIQSVGAKTAPVYTAKNILRVTSHDFGGAATAWTLSADEALCFYLIVTNANGAADIIAPHIEGTTYCLRNASGQAITLKKSGGTGIAVANGKTATLWHNGSDYVRATADQTH
jgi:hypothetical protein